MSPLLLALGGLLAYRTYQGQGRLAEMLGRTGPGTGPPALGALGQSGDVLGSLRQMFGGGSNAGTALSTGLTDLMKRFQDSGLGQAAQSWVNTGANEPVAPTDLERALGPDRIAWLMQETGMSRQELLDGLSRELPAAVDRLTPQGRVPSESEMNAIVQGENHPATAPSSGRSSVG